MKALADSLSPALESLTNLVRSVALAVVSRHVVLDPEKVVVRLERGKTVSTLEVDIEVPNNFDKSKALADRRRAG